MDDISIREVKDRNDEALDRVEELFEEMYRHILDKGLKNPLVEGGERLWMDSVKKSLARFGALLVAENQGKVIGFVHGLVRFLPDFLGGEKVGFVTHQHIEKDYRGKGLGKDLMESLEEWFRSKGIRQVELQANYYNEYSRKYLEHSGYEYEIVQFRKFL